MECTASEAFHTVANFRFRHIHNLQSRHCHRFWGSRLPRPAGNTGSCRFAFAQQLYSTWQVKSNSVRKALAVVTSSPGHAEVIKRAEISRASFRQLIGS